MAVTSVPITGASTIAGYSVTLPFTTTDNYTFSFPYLSQDDFVITVNSETELTSTEYTFTSDYLIQLTATGVANLTALYGSSGTADLVIRRRTTLSSRLVDFQDGANILEADLDLSSNQLFYLIQEIYDTAEIGAPEFNPVSGAIDMGSVSLINIAESTTLTSAVTLNQLFNNVVTPDYTEGDTYRTGRLVFSGGDLYRANKDIASAPAVINAPADWDTVLTAAQLAQIATNTANIATNAANIASNDTDIANNAANIATNTANIATNVSAIASKADASALTAHEAENETAHTERGTKAALDTWAETATNGAMAYATDEKKQYIVTDGVLVELGAGGAGGGGLSVFHTENFENTLAADASTGKNATFLGGGTLDGTFDDETVAPIAGSSSIKYVQGVSSATVYAAFPAVTLDLKQKDKFIGIDFYSTYDGNDNEIDFVVWDVTNSTVLVSVPIRKSNVPLKHSAYFNTASTTASIRYGFHVQTGNSGATLLLDDIEAKVDPLTPTDIYASSELVDSGAITIDGSTTAPTKGTTVTDKMMWRRDGEFMEIFYEYRQTSAGSDGIGDYIIRIPSGYTIDTNFHSASTAGNQYNSVGSGFVSNTSTGEATSSNIANINVVDSTGLTMETHLSGTTMNAFGSTHFGFSPTNLIFSGHARVKIAGWSNTAQGVVVKNVESKDIANTNVFSARIENNGTTASIVSQNLDFIESVTRTGAGIVDVVFKSGVFSAVPSVTAIPSDSPFYIVGISGAVTTSGFTVEIKNNTTGANSDEAFDFKVHRQGTDFVKESEKVYTVPVDSLTGNRVVASGNGANVLTVNDPVPFTEETDTAGAWDGDQYTVQKNNSMILIQGSTYFNSAGNRYMALFKNNTLYKQFTYNLVAGNSVYPFSFVLSRGETASGDVLEIRSDNAGGTLIDNPNYHYITITEEYGDRGVFLGTFGQPTCYVKDVKAASTDGGNASAGDQIRDLNTLEGDCSFVSLASNTFTLEAGTYYIDATAPVFRGDRSIAYIYNTTDASNAILGKACYSSSTSNAQVECHVNGKVSINGSKSFNLRHVIATASATNGLGVSSQSGVSDTYSTVKITKVR